MNFESPGSRFISIGAGIFSQFMLHFDDLCCALGNHVYWHRNKQAGDIGVYRSIDNSQILRAVYLEVVIGDGLAIGFVRHSRAAGGMMSPGFTLDPDFQIGFTRHLFARIEFSLDYLTQLRIGASYLLNGFIDGLKILLLAFTEIVEIDLGRIPEISRSQFDLAAAVVRVPLEYGPAEQVTRPVYLLKFGKT
jgi:hypothetical protein